jgi:LPXTG-site transpeptidase (sortase) family protein
MRKIGVIFILVLIGMLIWRASLQEIPGQSPRMVSATAQLEARSGTTPSVSIDHTLPELPVEKIAHKKSQVIPAPSKGHAGIESDLENEAGTKREDIIREHVQVTKEFERLLIPSLKVNASIISKPYSELTWDLSNLGQEVAFLTDIPNQTSEKNVVLAGHVTVRDGSHGPFRYLWKLNSGDQVILRDKNSVYTYSVREQILVYPEETSILNDTPEPQLVLITCTTWDEDTLSYLRRRIIIADLESIETRQVLVD